MLSGSPTPHPPKNLCTALKLILDRGKEQSNEISSSPHYILQGSLLPYCSWCKENTGVRKHLVRGFLFQFPQKVQSSLGSFHDTSGVSTSNVNWRSALMNLLLAGLFIIKYNRLISLKSLHSNESVCKRFAHDWVQNSTIK
ncbi:hypothetical protein ATANTOWER_016527 [Ataeniobius toweri]|uniref:Uncharacterized protein n=1 Tax=Ataeniobius toweri TaxID=208326 RepID=A0ABU7BCH5_9TELE|nr:hypothetical protein [Ataeniobius toweri]